MERPLRPRSSSSGAGQQRTTAGVAEIVGGGTVEVACKTVAALNGAENVMLEVNIDWLTPLNCQQVSFVVNKYSSEVIVGKNTFFG